MSDKKSKKVRILIPVVAVLAVGGAAFGGYAAAGGPADDDLPEEIEEPADGEVVEVGELTVSLAGPDSPYARVGLAVVLAEGVSPDEVTDRLPLLKDAALLAVADRTPDELRSRAGLEDLRDSLSEIAGEIYEEGEVLRVILVEAIVT